MVTLIPEDRTASLMVGPIIWAVYFIFSYTVSGFACSQGYGEQELAGGNLIRLLLVAFGILAGLLMVVAVLQARRGLHRARQVAQQTDQGAAARRQFLYGASLGLCALSLVGVLWLSMNALLTPIC